MKKYQEEVLMYMVGMIASILMSVITAILTENFFYAMTIYLLTRILYILYDGVYNG